MTTSLAAGGLTPMSVAWDGRWWYASTSDLVDSGEIVRYNAGGVLDRVDAVPIDVRSVFTLRDGVGPTTIRAFDSRDLQVETAPGSMEYGPRITLEGGTLGPENRIFFDPVRELYVSNDRGTISRWDATGAFFGNAHLLSYILGYGEWDHAVVPTPGGCYLTARDGVLTVWDMETLASSTTRLEGAGTGVSAAYTFSYAGGLVWLHDGYQWEGFDVGL
ncbi:MAG: hypothetical protein ACI8PZ_007305 [Myxococcota bacterium]|jgi:hypothetical protein